MHHSASDRLLSQHLVPTLGDLGNHPTVSCSTITMKIKPQTHNNLPVRPREDAVYTPPLLTHAKQYKIFCIPCSHPVELEQGSFHIP